MTRQSDALELRRQFLIRALRAGLFAVAGSTFFSSNALAGAFGRVPRILPAGQSIYEVRGRVTVNGAQAISTTMIGPAAEIETGKDGRLIFAVGQDAFLLRENSRLTLSGDDHAMVQGLRLLTGALLSVFGKRAHEVATPTATIGIRGTGLYVEAAAGYSYVCTCYGTTEIAAVDDATSRETIVSRHHDAPRYVFAQGEAGARIQQAPFKNHTDLELALIEALVGRVPPFNLFDDEYGSPRRY